MADQALPQERAHYHYKNAKSLKTRLGGFSGTRTDYAQCGLPPWWKNWRIALLTMRQTRRADGRDCPRQAPDQRGLAPTATKRSHKTCADQRGHNQSPR